MKLLDSRRLTGPNLLWNKPGAIIDVSLEAENNAVVDIWRSNVRKLFNMLDWNEHDCCVRVYPDGASLAISAPIDVLYTATEINEWCWDCAVENYSSGVNADFEKALEEFTQQLEEESNSKVIQLQQFAEQNNLPFLRDDDEVSLGLGRNSQTWIVSELPDISTLDISGFSSIPVGLITGTNGKTTSTRVASHIIQTSGLNAGISSTDWIAVNDQIIDKGDYSGPGGARSVLRDKRVDVAVLETARGGLLRRGLGVEYADVALITNIAEDHMGEFGVQTLDELADVKWIVTSVINESGIVVLNAEDPLLVNRAKKSDLNIGWFSMNSENPLIQQNIKTSRSACTLEDNHVVLYHNGQKSKLIHVNDIPVTLQGAATHNVQNVLGVVLFSHALGLSLEQITKGLQTFSNKQNPGRCNQYNINKATIIVDFAHNPHGMKAFMEVARNLNAKRKLLVTGQAGDRSDNDIKRLAIESTKAVKFDKILIKLMKQYDRGRATGEAANILKQQYVLCGVNESEIELIEDELDAVKEAVNWATPDDLVILLIHEQRSKVLEYLTEIENSQAQ